MSAVTERLFWPDPYATHFTARVVALDGTDLVLDRSLFYAESGGQVGDTGVVAGVRVTDTKFGDGKTVIHHHLANAPDLAVGAEVAGEIDWPRRYTLMRLHSALHITGMLFQQMYGDAPVVGSNISPDKARIDYAFFDPINLPALAQSVNAFISADHPITMYGDAEDVLRRYWRVEGLPDVPCGGTHPRRTAEIGPVALKLKAQGKQGQRIYVSFAQ